MNTPLHCSSFVLGYFFQSTGTLISTSFIIRSISIFFLIHKIINQIQIASFSLGDFVIKIFILIFRDLQAVVRWRRRWRIKVLHKRFPLFWWVQIGLRFIVFGFEHDSFIFKIGYTCAIDCWVKIFLGSLMLHVFLKIFQVFFLFLFFTNDEIKELLVELWEIIKLLFNEWLYLVVSLLNEFVLLLNELVLFHKVVLVIWFCFNSSFLSFIFCFFSLLFDDLLEFLSFYLDLLSFLIKYLFDLLRLLFSHLFSLDQHLLPAFDIFFSVVFFDLFTDIFKIFIDFLANIDIWGKNFLKLLSFSIHDNFSSSVFHIKYIVENIQALSCILLFASLLSIKVASICKLIFF